MSAAATKDDIDEVLSVLRDFMQQVDDRFNQADLRFTRIESDLTEIKAELADLHQSHDRLLNTIDGFVARIDRYETEQLARDRQFEKLLDWARKVSAKTGIPLENL